MHTHSPLLEIKQILLKGNVWTSVRDQNPIIGVFASNLCAGRGRNTLHTGIPFLNIKLHAI